MDWFSRVERYADALATADQMMGWIDDVVRHGIRRPGYEAGRRVEEWCAARFRDLGLQDVRLEPFPVPVWEPGDASLVAWPEDRPHDRMQLPGFALPYTRPHADEEADLVLLGPDATAPNGVAGAIAVDVIELVELPPSFMHEVATACVDPDGELDGHGHVLPLSARLGREVDTAAEAGASGYVGVLAGMPWTTRDYYLPYDAVDRPLAGLWIDRDAGARLLSLLERGPVRGRVVVDARRTAGQSANVIGTLPGASDEWVVVGSHHDAPWASAVEDASGIALVLAQASFWARVPRDDRPHNLLFLLNGAHMAGGAGFSFFVEQHRDLLDAVVLAVHLEHAAAAWRTGDDGRLVAGDDAEVRWWFTTEEPQLQEAVAAALGAEGLGRSWILPPEVFGTFPPTDGGGLHLEGVPLVDFLTAPVYLFDACDTVDKVHRPSLEPLTRATVRVVESVAGRTATDIRAAAKGL